MTVTQTWLDEEALVVDGVEFVVRLKPRVESTPDRFFVCKSRELCQAHLDLLAELRPRYVVELGILQGGSVALTAMAADPETLIAIERSAEPVAALDEFITGQGLEERVHPLYGIDQSDGPRLRTELDRILGDRPLDLVVDDASHLVDPTRASFNALFPRLRPGGYYVIEDWGWAHMGFGAQHPDQIPLSRLVFELTLLLKSTPGIVDEVHIDRFWATFVRGDAELDPADFDARATLPVRGWTVLTDTD